MAPATRSAKGKALAERNMEEKCDQMGDFIKRPKECLEENYVSEIEKLKDLLEASQKKCNEIELLMKAKEEELNSLKEKFAKEQSDKLEAMDSFTKEKEARLSGERLQASLSEYLNRAGREIADMNQKIQSLNDLYKPPQERNTSLQRYNIQLQEELGTAYDALKRMAKEKAAVVENLSTLRGHYTSLQEQLTSSRNSQEEAVRQKEVLANEVGCVRSDMQQLRDDRDRQLLQVQILTEELTKCHKFVGRSSADLDSLTVKLGSHGVI